MALASAYLPHFTRDAGPASNCDITVDVTIPLSGQAYVNLHLDRGLKGGGTDANICDDEADRYDRGSADLVFGGWDARENVLADDGSGLLALANCNDYGFSYTDGTDTFSDNVENINEFKKISGAFGMCTHSNSGQPCAGTLVTLTLDETGEIVKTADTDEDGFYGLIYKHTGPAAWYTVDLLGEYQMSAQVKLKANGWAQVMFDPDTGEIEVETGPGGGGGGGNGHGNGNGNGNGHASLGN
jgi:hypothetical protein